MPDAVADALRQQAARYHSYADDALSNCRHQPACIDARRAAEGYRAIALDCAQNAIRLDIIEGTVHQ